MKGKKYFWILPIIILSVISIIGCESDTNKPNSDFVYPLMVGNNWEYDKTYTLDFDELATSNGLVDTICSFTGSVEIIANEVIFDSLEVYNFATILNDGGYVTSGNEYYNNNDNCLFEYGYTNPLMLTPKNNENFAFLIFDDKKFGNVREIVDYVEKGIIGNEHSRDDSIYYDPVKSLEYPLNEDSYWIYRTSNNPWRIDKEVVGWEETDVPAGSFNCWIIKWTFPESSWNDDIDYYDFITEQGLIKRTIEFNNIGCIDESFNIIGHLDSIEETYLTDFQINN